MLSSLGNRQHAADAQEAFRRHFEGVGVVRQTKVGYPGHSRIRDVNWMADEGIWACFEVRATRYWNVFGVGLQKSNSITCEINFPIEPGLCKIEQIKQITGALARDEAGTVWVLHRGRFRGIGRPQFERQYRGRWQNVAGEPCAVIAALDQADLIRCVADFVRLVDSIPSP